MSEASLYQHQNTAQDVQLRAFNHGVRIQPDRFKLLRSGEEEGVPLAELSAADVAASVFKDIAFYDLAVGGSQRRELFAALWAEWLPLRDRTLTGEESKVSVHTVLRAWLAACFNCIGSHETAEWREQVTVEPTSQELDSTTYEAVFSQCALEWLVRWHEGFCDRARGLIGSGEGKEYNVPQDVNFSFRNAFIILDRGDWLNAGCLVCCEVAYAANLGLTVDQSDRVAQGTREWRCWRLSLKDAIQRILQNSRHTSVS